MGSFNFDVLFSGDLRTQALKVHDFIEGIEHLRSEAQKNFAATIVHGRSTFDVVDELAAINETAQALVKDERLIPLVKFISEDVRKKNRENLRAQLDQVVEEVLR